MNIINMFSRIWLLYIYVIMCSLTDPLWSWGQEASRWLSPLKKMTAQKSGTSAAAAAAAFSMADRIRRPWAGEELRWLGHPRWSGILGSFLLGETPDDVKGNTFSVKSQLRTAEDYMVNTRDFDRKQDFLMKLHIPVVDKRKKRLNRSCSVLTKAGFLDMHRWRGEVWSTIKFYWRPIYWI